MRNKTQVVKVQEVTKINTETELQAQLKKYISWLEQIDSIKQELKTILEEIELIPGVKKKGFKSIAIALYEAPGTIDERLEAMNNFITIAFSKDGNQDEINFTE